MKVRLALLDLILVVDDLENTGAQLCAKLAKDAVGLKGLNHKVFQLVHFESKLFSTMMIIIFWYFELRSYINI